MRYLVLMALVFSVQYCGRVAELSDPTTLNAEAPLAFKIAELLPVSIGVQYKELLPREGGVSPDHYSITSGKLLSGLTLDESSGVISGLLPADQMIESTTFTAKVVDSAGITADIPHISDSLATGIVLKDAELMTLTEEADAPRNLNADISVHRVQIKKIHNRLEVSAEIKNKSRELSRGHLWVLAIYTDGEGRSRSFSSAPLAKIDESGIAKNPAAAETYSILWHKEAKFSIELSGADPMQLSTLIFGSYVPKSGEQASISYEFRRELHAMEGISR